MYWLSCIRRKSAKTANFKVQVVPEWTQTEKQRVRVQTNFDDEGAHPVPHNRCFILCRAEGIFYKMALLLPQFQLFLQQLAMHHEPVTLQHMWRGSH